MTDPRRICVVTGTRAEYGLLQPTMTRLRDADSSELRVLVTGTHLSPGFGNTVESIRADGFDVDAEVELVLDSDSPWASASSVGVGLISMAGALRHMSPDLVVVLGDRFEILAAAQAAFFGGVPVAHIHGGEVTLGAQDECIRHAVTKLSRLHLVSTEEHRRRVIQLGEAPDTVHNVGAPGIECIATLALDDRDAFAKRIGVSLGRPVVLLTYHPVTQGDEDPTEGIEAILTALEQYPEAVIIASGSNADAGGRAIQARLNSAAQELGPRLHLTASLGQVGYLSAMRHADVVIGNSSSGVIEAPSMGVPTVNVGVRQDGRPRAASVIDCAPQAAAIGEALKRALSGEMVALAGRRDNPYASQGTDVSARIVDALMNADLERLRGPKMFYDVSFSLTEDA